VAGEVDDRRIIEDAAIPARAEDRRLHAIIEDLGRNPRPWPRRHPCGNAGASAGPGEKPSPERGPPPNWLGPPELTPFTISAGVDKSGLAIAAPRRLRGPPRLRCRKAVPRVRPQARRPAPRPLPQGRSLDAQPKSTSGPLLALILRRKIFDARLERIAALLANSEWNVRTHIGSMSLNDARWKCGARRRDYNEERPHSAIGNKAPIELVNSAEPHHPPSPKYPGRRPAACPRTGAVHENDGLYRFLEEIPRFKSY
jgi:hypothetical protein